MIGNEIPIFRSIELIERHISEKLTVEMLANDIYFSKYHYQRIFREVVGSSVMEYVTKRKLTLAGKALLETKAAIIDIAMDYGFDSREGFMRSFKAYMGVTPTEYRKYNLSAISQKSVKERQNTMYSKTTDEIIRELNQFVAKAKESATSARKCEIDLMAPYWNLIADKTERLAEDMENTIIRVLRISESPDEITNRFAIIKAIEDAAFELNIILLNVNLTVARNLPQYIEPQRKLCDRYEELAQESAFKAKRVIEFMNELAVLIFDDMKKELKKRIEVAIAAGNAAAQSITGYNYIKHEVINLTNELKERPFNEITVSWLDDNIYKLRIISFTADTDLFRFPSDIDTFGGITVFRECLQEVYDFIVTLNIDIAPIPTDTGIAKFLMDIAYQGNIMLFYLRGEIEKMTGVRLSNGGVLSEEQISSFSAICDNTSDYIQYTLSANDETAYKPIADSLYKIKADLSEQADILGDIGGAVRFLSEQFGRLADVVMRYANSEK